jgi:CubicO group peptidase (beta-lactamase class C family)
MRNTGFLGEEVPELATPYVVPQEGQPHPGKIRPIPIGSDGALVSTVLDLAKYLGMWLRRGAPLLSEKSYEELVKPRVPIPSEPRWPEPVGQAFYALGLSVQKFFGRTSNRSRRKRFCLYGPHGLYSGGKGRGGGLGQWLGLPHGPIRSSGVGFAPWGAPREAPLCAA